MPPDYVKLLRGYYNPDTCCALYWKNTNPELLYECMAPLARLILNQVMRGAYANDEDYLQEGLAALADDLRKRKYSHTEEDPVHFDRYYWWLLRRTYIAYYHFLCNKPPVDPYKEYRPMYQITHPQSMEWKVYLSQIPTLIRQMLADRIRFTGPEQIVCMYIAKRLLTGKMPVKRCLKVDYGVKSVEDMEFYTNYMRVLLRSIIREIRDSNALHLGALKHFAYEDPTYERIESAA